MKKLFILAGSDSSGAAGVQADLRTCTKLGVYGICDLTCLVTMNPQNNFLHKIEPFSKEKIIKQFETASSIYDLDSIKIGMLPNKDAIDAAYEILKSHNWKNVVLDPVLFCKGNEVNSDNREVELAKYLLEKLVPLAMVITPNIDELEVLSEVKVTSKNTLLEAVKNLKDKGVKNIIVKLRDEISLQEFGFSKEEILCIQEGVQKDLILKVDLSTIGKVVAKPKLEKNINDKFFIDFLFSENMYNPQIYRQNIFVHKKIDAKKPISGAGCTLSTAIASYLVKDYSVEKALKYVSFFMYLASKNNQSTNAPFNAINQLFDKSL